VRVRSRGRGRGRATFGLVLMVWCESMRGCEEACNGSNGKKERGCQLNVDSLS